MRARLLRRTLITGSAAAVAATAFAVVPAPALALGCTDWTPVLTASTVNQGLGTYSPLVRGKTTLVRLFITQPSCASTGQEQLLGGTLTVFNAAGQQMSPPVNTTPAATGPVNPALESYGSTAPDSTGYPEYKLPAFGLDDTTAGTFTATFQAAVKYSYAAATGVQQATANYTLTARVAPKPNALRILVVPMGDKADDFKNEFPESTNGGTPIRTDPLGTGEYADTVVQNAMQTLSRTLPVYDGVGDLNSGAGLRYTLDDSAMIDLGTRGLGMMNENPNLGPIRPFCSTSTYFSNNVTSETDLGQNSVAGQLAAFRSWWNTNNPSTPVDKVLGVIWQKVSQGSQYSCDDGRAMINGNEAFIRLFADDTVGTTGKQNPSMSGALATMELAHSWGAAPTGTARVSATHHSVNVSADPTNTKRGYDVRLVKWLATPESGMHYDGDPTGYDSPSNGSVSPWNDTNVLLEQQDYAYTQCQLTPGMSSTDCPATATTGALGSAGAAAQAVVLSGTTDGTVAGTAIHSYYARDPAPTAPGTPTSQYWLQTYGTGGTVNTPLPDGLDQTQHGALPGTPGDVINAAVALDGVSGFSIWKGQPPAAGVCHQADVGTLANCLFARAAQPPPLLISTGGSMVLGNPKDFTNAPGDEGSAALSPDGRYLAWVAADGIHVQQRDGSTNLPPAGAQPSAPLPGTSPSWSPDGASIAFATSAGDIQTAAVNRAASPPTFGAAQTVYNHLLQGVLGDTSAHHPSWSHDGGSITAEIAGNIFSFSSAPSQNSNAVICDLANLVDTLTCKVLTKDGDNAGPSWGPSGLIAYEHGADIWTVDPAVPGRPQVLRIQNATAPSFGDNLLAFTQAGNVSVTNTTAADPAGMWSTVTTLGTAGHDSAPSLDGSDTAVAFGRTTTTNGVDVFDGSLTESQSGPLQFVAATTGDPKVLEADMYITCAWANRPVLVTLRPVSTTQNAYTVNGTSYNTATFSTPYDASTGCPGGEVYARVTDGFNLSSRALVRTIASDQPGPRKLPLPAIAAPRPGSSYLQFDPVIAIGSSIDGTTTNKANTTVCWTLTGPSGSGYSGTPVGCVLENEIDPPQAPAPNGVKGWVPGQWTLKVTVTDPATGQTASTSVAYTVLPDPQNVGMNNATVSFNPSTLYVPSSGNDVTVNVKSQAGDLRSIDARTVAITRVGNHVTSIPVDTASGTTGWVRNSDGTYTAKFNRQTLTCFIATTGLTGLYVPIVVSGTGSAFSFSGFDRDNPLTTPGSGVTC